METYITYEGLPLKSGGAHLMGKQPLNEIYLKTASFIEKFTNGSSSPNLKLTFFNSQNGTYSTIPVLWSLIKEFGLFSNWRSWNLMPRRQHFWTWNLEKSQFIRALNTVNSRYSLPENPYGPLELEISWHFKFKDLNTGLILERQEDIPEFECGQQDSYIRLSLSPKTRIRVWFVFPFNSLDAPNLEYLSSILQELPFKPSEKHWRQWNKNINGSWYPRKLTIV